MEIDRTGKVVSAKGHGADPCTSDPALARPGRNFAGGVAGGNRRAQISRLERSPACWAMVAALILLNVWYDHYHPLGIMFDVVLGVGLLIGYLSKSKAAQ